MSCECRASKSHRQNWPTFCAPKTDSQLVRASHSHPCPCQAAYRNHPELRVATARLEQGRPETAPDQFRTEYAPLAATHLHASSHSSFGIFVLTLFVYPRPDFLSHTAHYGEGKYRRQSGQIQHQGEKYARIKLMCACVCVMFALFVCMCFTPKWFCKVKAGK